MPLEVFMLRSVDEESPRKLRELSDDSIVFVYILGSTRDTATVSVTIGNRSTGIKQNSTYLYGVAWADFA